MYKRPRPPSPPESTFAETPVFNTNTGGHGSLFNTNPNAASTGRRRGLNSPPSTLTPQHPHAPLNAAQTSPSRNNSRAGPHNTILNSGSDIATPGQTRLHTPAPPAVKPGDLLASLQAQFEYTKELERELSKRQRLIFGRDNKITILQCQIEKLKTEVRTVTKFCASCHAVMY
ncbi:hypothetical protein SeLEV6574_g05439 [Synchytrium endobioticum]|uniref:Uncharacterized protein n=1 Tax=Synchytrium endobioticum TaxID=286115 RepID=A0A507CUF2_9FUNG|nr:hypothetical protein SeLEV6574_g05439 [Synchytrium endobioticum]